MKAMRVIVVAAALACALLASARGAEPRVRVLGGRAVGNDRAAALLRSAGFPLPGSVRSLQETYMAQGYLFASIDVRLEADSSFTVIIDEGDIARIGSARIKGASFRDAGDIARRLELERGEPFHPQRLSHNIQAVLADYDDAGYPFAQVWVDSLGLDADSGIVDIALYVVEGFPREIRGVVVEGLQKTRSDLAQRIAGVEPGVPYRAEILEDVYLRMVSSGVFNDVEFPTVRVSSDGEGVDAVVRVDESRQSHSFVAAVGYASAEGGSDRVLSGLAHIDLRNIGGTLKDFGAAWNGDGQGRTETRIRYRDRLFLGRRLGVGVRVEQVGQDTLYTWQSLGLDVEKGFGRVAGTLTSVSLGAFGDRNVFSTGALVRTSRVRGRGGVTLLWGSERRAAYARVGLGATFASKDLTYREGSTGPGNVHQMIYEGSLETIVPAFWSLHYSLSGEVNSLESREASVPLSEQFTIGGARTVRGYRENQYHGRRTAFARNELRLGRTPREGLYLFADVGYVLQEETPPDGEITERGQGLAGFGFGVRSASRLGWIDLSFAVGDEVSLQATKVHVLLEQKF